MEEVDKDKSENNNHETAYQTMRVYVEDHKRFMAWCKLQGSFRPAAFKIAVDLLVGEDVKRRDYTIEELKKSKSGNKYKYEMTQLNIRVFPEDYERFMAWCKLHDCFRSIGFKIAVDRLVDEDMLKVRVSKAQRLILKNWCQKGGVDESVATEKILARAIDKLVSSD